MPGPALGISARRTCVSPFVKTPGAEVPTQVAAFVPPGWFCALESSPATPFEMHAPPRNPQPVAAIGLRMVSSGPAPRRVTFELARVKPAAYVPGFKKTTPPGGQAERAALICA